MKWFFRIFSFTLSFGRQWRHDTRRRVSANCLTKVYLSCWPLFSKLSSGLTLDHRNCWLKILENRKSLGRLCVQFHFSQVYSSWSLKRFHISTIAKFHGKTTKKYIKYLLTNVLFLHKAKPQKKWCNLACWKSCSKEKEEHTLNNWNNLFIPISKSFSVPPNITKKNFLTFLPSPLPFQSLKKKLVTKYDM